MRRQFSEKKIGAQIPEFTILALLEACRDVFEAKLKVRDLI